MYKSTVFLFMLALTIVGHQPGIAQETNPHAFLDEFCNPYYPHQKFPRLTTPQWIGEPGIEAVITLGIDDMRDPAVYEAFLRPILERLKKIDGRAPVSIMTCSIDPKNEQLQTWLAEGVSIECHTIDHPCPCLQGGDFSKAKTTYDRCVDLMNSIPGNRPVAFRFPCMDSLNTPSPRGYSEIINQSTPMGHHLQISTSVTCLFTKEDPEIATLFDSKQGEEKSSANASRFQRYIPFPSFVNRVDNYPYPFVVGRKCWEFPCTIPDDWQGQNIQRPNNPKTVVDLKAALDATILKKGVANIVFHPHGWIRAEQVVDVIDYIDQKYGKRVKFLAFDECIEKINRHLLQDNPIRSPNEGRGNGVRILDLNQDGYMDVFIGNKKTKMTRIWNPKTQSWQSANHPFLADSIRFGSWESESYIVNQTSPGKFRFWKLDNKQAKWNAVSPDCQLPTQVSIDAVRLRDLNGDGKFEVIVADPSDQSIYQLTDGKLSRLADFPAAIVDAKGNDNGLRFVDLDQDSLDDIVYSNESESGVFLFSQTKNSFQKIKPGTSIPPIVSEGKNNGVWFANEHLWIQNEHTNRLPDGVDRRKFQEIIANAEPKPQSPKESLDSIKVPDNFQVQLMAAEPHVMDPIALEWGIDGKLWVVEMADYPLGIDDQGKPGGRIRYLEDTNQDGSYDKSTVFVDQIPFPTGVFPINLDPAKPACLISAAPLVVLADRPGHWNELVETAGDPPAPSPNIWLRGFGEGNQQHRFNGFSYGLDNWFYLANGDSGGMIENPRSGQRLNIQGRDLRFRKTTDELRLEAQSGQTQFGRHRDDWGNWFGCSNPLPIRHYILSDHYLRRNPHFKYPPSHRDIARADNTQIYPRSRVLSHWSGYRPPATGQPHRFTSACSTNFYRDDLFGEGFQGNVFTCEPVHNLVHRRTLKTDGLTFQSQRPEDQLLGEFLASSDSWFRPTYITTGPDGALWITDMYRLVIEHPEWIDNQREKELFLRAGHDRGRIYRVFKKDVSLRPLPTSGNQEGIQWQALVQNLMSPNRWRREISQYLLVHQTSSMEPEVQAAIQNKLILLLNEAKNPLAQLHAANTLDGRGELTSELLTKLIKSKHPDVRRHAIRMAEVFLAQSDRTITAAVCSCIKDTEPRVLLQLAYSLGFGKLKECRQTLCDLGIQSMASDHLLAAVTSSLGKSNLEDVLQHARSRQPLGDFTLHLCEQALRMKKSQLAFPTLDVLFESTDPAELTTAQLEKIAQLISLIPTNQKPEPTRIAASRSFSAKINSLLASSATILPQRQIALMRLIGKSPFLPIQNRIADLVQPINAANDIAVQVNAVSLLGEFSDASIASVLLAKYRSVSPTVQKEILSVIIARTDWTKILLEGIENKKYSQLGLSASTVRQLTAHVDPAIASQAKKLFATPTRSDRVDIINDYRSKLSNSLASGSQPDRLILQSGQAIFQKRCSTCHQVGTLGTGIGPDLMALRDRSADTLLRAILDPNSAVEDKYRNYLFSLKDGRSISGVIESESSNQINVANADGKRLTLLRSDIEMLRSTPQSFMPEGFEKDISAKEMSQLLQFLLINTPQPKSFAGNHPALVKPSPTGGLRLDATTARIFGPSAIFETKYKNIGFWADENDFTQWNVTVEKSGKFNVWLNYASVKNSAGNSYSISSPVGSIKGQVKSTGSWDQYERVLIGSLDLQAGQQSIDLRPDRPVNGFLMDFKALELVPVE
jgi:putative membrane-bound dehydrogenase-like protein